MAEETKVETVEVAAAETNVMDTIVHDENASVVTLKKLLEAGVHYGHPTKKWNPKMGKYIYCPRNGIYIIDLNKTQAALIDAYKKLESIDDNFTVFQGIVTGNNEAFIFESESDAVSKGVDKELLHPLCHGIDIEKYKVRSLERRILYIDNSVDIENIQIQKNGF